MSRATPKRRTCGNTGPDIETRRLVLTRDGHTCVCCGEAVHGRPYSIHHRRNRGMGGSRLKVLNSPVNLITVCGSATTFCHGQLTQPPTGLLHEFRDLGWIVRKSADPAKVPVYVHGIGMVYLTPDGGRVPTPDDRGVVA